MVRKINKCENKFNKEGTIILVSVRRKLQILWEIEDQLNKGGIHHIMNSSMLFSFSPGSWQDNFKFYIEIRRPEKNEESFEEPDGIVGATHYKDLESQNT